MGWYSGTEYFDAAAALLLGKPPKDKKAALKNLIQLFEGGDWDCEHDSAYFDHPLFQEVWREMYPED